MALPQATPPLLLTKRLTAFLHANQTPQLPTLLLTTSTGKLLAHASPQPVAVLRTHATVAASLLSIHGNAAPVLPSALPGSRTPDPIGSSPLGGGDDDDADDEARSQDFDPDAEPSPFSEHPNPAAAAAAARARAPKPSTVTVQLSGGTVVIRRLKCGLLFVCIGPAGTSSDASVTGATADAVAHQPLQTLDPHHHLLHHPHHQQHHSAPVSHAGSPGDADSMLSAGAQTTASLETGQGASAAVVALRRHAADLARWLDGKLGSLAVPEEGVGGE